MVKKNQGGDQGNWRYGAAALANNVTFLQSLKSIENT